MKKTPKPPQKNRTNTFATTKSELAQRCNISRPTLRRYLKMPGAPAVTSRGWAVATIQGWISSHTGRGDLLGRIDPEFEDLRRWEIYERARWLQMKNDRDAGLLMLKTEVERQWSHCISEASRLLGAIPQRLAPAIVGLTVPEAEKLLKHALDEAIKELAT